MNITLLNCEDEKIQYLNQIQDFGFLIGVSKTTNLVQFYSENITNIFGDLIKLNSPINGILPLEYSVLNNLNEGEYLRLNIKISEIDYHLVAYSYNDSIYVEFEEIIHQLDYSLFFKYAEKLEFSHSEEEVWTQLVHAIKSLIDYDRVMIYKFLDDNSGVVVAEEINKNVESYLGMHFPEFDIPLQARNLYLKKKNRLVSDINSERINIISINDEIIDLTYSEVRALSPIHLQYLKNFNSKSSFSISIIVDDKLWGIVACQSIEPKHIPITLRKKAEILTNIAKDIYINTKHKAFLHLREEYKHLLMQLKESLILCEDFNEIMIHLQEMLEFSEADGLAFLDNDKLFVAGETPNADEIFKIKEWALKREEPNEIFYSHSFYKDLKSLGDFSHNSAGIAFKFLDLECRYFLIWFRKPNAITKNWAGDPNKILSIDYSDNQEVHHFSPRKNFEIWSEVVEFQSAFWRDKSLLIIEEVNRIIIETIHVKSTKILELYDQLREINDELDRFSYTVSHDLRAPLTVMRLSCQMLQKSLNNDEVNSLKLANILNEIDNLSNMLNEILALSKTKKADIKLELIDAKELVEQIVFTAKTYHESSLTEVKIDNTINFYADRTMAYEIFLNVIGNAIKYSSKVEKPIVRIDSVSNGDYIEYHIYDNGIGIKEEENDKMFKLFSRMSNTNGFEGNGIGLSIVYRMMERLDGSISFNSKEGEGSEFILRFKKRDL